MQRGGNGIMKCQVLLANTKTKDKCHSDRKKKVLFILAYKVYFCLSYLYLKLIACWRPERFSKLLSHCSSVQPQPEPHTHAHKHPLPSAPLAMNMNVSRNYINFTNICRTRKATSQSSKKMLKVLRDGKKINLDWRQQIMKDPSAAAWAEMSGMKPSPQKVPKSCTYMGERIFIVPE